MKLDVEQFLKQLMVVLLTLPVDCSLLTLKPARSSSYLPKDEQVYKVYSDTPKDPNNTTVAYTPDKESAAKEAEKLGRREENVKVKKVR